MSAQIISLFNHKGGVSKTTTTFNLGWALAESGRRVLIVDGDPQCNLTGTVLGFNGQSDFDSFYDNNPQSDLNTCLSPVLQGSQSPLQAANPVQASQSNLFLLAGHIDLAVSEAQLSVALSTGATAIPALRNLPGSISNLLRLTAQQHDFDVVLLDMSPSVGAFNQCFLMGSDFFIVPTFPDYFCDQAIRSLSRVLPRWNTDSTSFRDPSLTYPLPSDPPKFIGTVSQRYRPRGGEPSASFQEWIDRIKATVNDSLVPELNQSNMAISDTAFTNANPDDSPFNLINISDFNTLIAQSHKHNTPVFALSDAQIERQGVILENMRQNRETFREAFESLAETIADMTGI